MKIQNLIKLLHAEDDKIIYEILFPLSTLMNENAPPLGNSNIKHQIGKTATISEADMNETARKIS